MALSFLGSYMYNGWWHIAIIHKKMYFIHSQFHTAEGIFGMRFPTFLMAGILASVKPTLDRDTTLLIPHCWL